MEWSRELRVESGGCRVESGVEWSLLEAGVQ